MVYTPLCVLVISFLNKLKLVNLNLIYICCSIIMVLLVGMSKSWFKHMQMLWLHTLNARTMFWIRLLKVCSIVNWWLLIKRLLLKACGRLLQSDTLTRCWQNWLFLTRRFCTNHMNINETLQQHVNKLNNMAKELDAIANVVLAKVKAMVLLTSLPNSY